MSKGWTQATQGSALEYRQGRRVKKVFGRGLIAVNSTFTETESATHTHPE